MASRRPPLPESHDDVALLTLADVRALTRYSEGWLYAALKEGRFPAPAIRAHRGNRWLLRDIRAWLERQTAAA